MAKFTPPKETSSKEFQVLPAGNHVARFVSFVDLGEQKCTFQGEEKEVRKIRISWETPNEKAVFNEESGEQPFMVSSEYTLSFHKKSNLRKMLSGIFPGFDQHQFDPEKDLLGKECMINVVHEISTKGRTFCKITSVAPVPKGMVCPAQINKSTYFFMGYHETGIDLDKAVFDKLPAFLQEKIESSPEYNEALKNVVEVTKEVMQKKIKSSPKYNVVEVTTEDRQEPKKK